MVNLAEVLTDSLLDRCDSLSAVFQRLGRASYPAPGPKALAAFCVSALRAIRVDIEDTHTQGIEGVLSWEEVEAQLLLHGQSLSYLHGLIERFEQSQLSESPFELVPSLRRLVQEFFAGADLIIQSGADFNYFFEDITAEIGVAFQSRIFDSARRELPSRLLRIGLPKAESRNVLLHAIVAHELGHGLYRQERLIDRIQPDTQLDTAGIQKKVDALVEDRFGRFESALQALSPASALPLDKFLALDVFRRQLQAELLRSIAAWVERTGM